MWRGRNVDASQIRPYLLLQTQAISRIDVAISSFSQFNRANKIDNKEEWKIKREKSFIQCQLLYLQFLWILCMQRT